MPQKPQTGVMTIGSQRDNRYLDTFYDQHRFTPRFPDGRPWHGFREFAANKPDRDGFIGGELTPGRHAEEGEDPKAAWATIWNAPWVPEFKYFDFNYLRNRITIRYDRVFGDDKSGQDKYYAAAAKLSGANGWGPVTYGVTPTYQVTAVIGDPPRSPKVAQAAQAGDPWLLGHSEEVNEELAILIGLTQEGLRLVEEPSQGLLKPDAVLAAESPKALQAMIAAAVQAALEARDVEEAAKKEANKQKMAALRAKKGGKSTTATLNRAS